VAEPSTASTAEANGSDNRRDYVVGTINDNGSKQVVSKGNLRCVCGPTLPSYLRVLFVQAAWVVLVRIKDWERYGLKSWIEAAKRRLHHNVLAIALADKTCPHRLGRAGQGTRGPTMQTSDPLDPRAVLGAVKTQPGNAGAQSQAKHDGRP